jgi:ribonuclease BN (tRNA processing enzyme)
VSSRVVVLGGCGAWPEAGRACSGFLVEHDEFRVVLDLGYGTLPPLLALLGSSTAIGLDAVVVTHDHPDHVVDLHGLFRARSYAASQEARIPLYAPAAVLDRIAGLEDSDRTAVGRVFDWSPLPGAVSRVGPFVMESWTLPHYVLNVGVRLSTPEFVLAYTGDTGPDAALVDLGHNADLYIVDSTDRHQRTGHAPSADVEPAMNLTARQAGEIARAAGARRLMLTHFWPDNDRERSRQAAAEAFAGEVLLADEGTEVPLQGPTRPTSPSRA